MTDRSTPSDTASHVQQRFGILFDRSSFEEVVTLALRPPSKAKLFCTCNLNHLRALQTNVGFQEAYRLAEVITMDSRPLRMLARLQLGETLPLVTGADLFPALVKQLRPGIDRPFFLASSPEVGKILFDGLLARGFSSAEVGHISPPFGFQNNEAYSADLLSQINALGTTHLFMGVGAPKSEIWIAKHFDELPAANVFCVGAALDFSSGLKDRAPVWIQKLSLEWLHRMLTEPKRLIPRYTGDAAFLARLLTGARLVPISASQPALTPTNSVEPAA